VYPQLWRIAQTMLSDWERDDCGMKAVAVVGIAMEVGPPFVMRLISALFLL